MLSVRAEGNGRGRREGRLSAAVSQQLCREAGDVAALAGGQGDVTEAALAAESLGQHREGVVRLAQVRRVDLAGVAGEDHLAALADAGEDRLQRRRLEVLQVGRASCREVWATACRYRT